MNQFDPMKGDSTSPSSRPTESDTPRTPEDIYHTAPEDSYRETDTRDTYREPDSPTGAPTGAPSADPTEDPTGGRGYTTPDGSHGFVYNDRERAAESRTRRYRGALIAVSAVLLTLLLTFGCLVGAWMAVNSLQSLGDREGSSSGQVGDGVDTSDGLYISDDDETGSSGTNGNSNGNGNGNALPEGIGTSAPGNATIHKLDPKRADTNGDGRADIVYGSSGEVLTSAGENAVSVATVVARVADSVVEIKTETVSQSGLIGQYVSSGAGSGVIISKEGYIVTNHHVIDGANTITVRLTDGTEYLATLVGTDEQTDVAVLWIDPKGRALTVATLGASYDLVVGEDILAIGNPLGSLGGTVTEGMVSATAREISVGGMGMTLLQVSAPINPGNSGGGLFNLAGELVGVVNAKVSSEEIEGLGFAIPIDTAYRIILELIDHGYVHGRPALGVELIEQVESSYFSSRRYVRVSDRDHAILQYGDYILAVDDVEVSTIDEVAAIVRQKSVGDTVELIVYRNKEQIPVSVTVVEDIPVVAAD